MDFFKFKKKFLNKNAGLSLIDVIVGTGLILLVFVSIFGVLKLSINVIAHSKARIGATSVAQDQIERMRSLKYDSVGTLNGIPAGNIAQIETITLNDIDYIRRTLIQYVDDPKDGEGVEDENGITADYKRAKVEVTWSVRGNNKSLSLITDIMPTGIESVSGGGTLIINVFDSLGIAILGANVHIENDTLLPVVSVDVSTNENGKVVFPGSPSANNYKITISKSGYNSAQTYDSTTGNPNPSPGHLSVLEGETTSVSFQVDQVSAKTIQTFSPIGTNSWQDLFNDTLKISQISTTTVSGSTLILEDFGSGFESSGFGYSQDISPQYLTSWNNFSWNENKPANTSILYRVYYYDSLSNLTIIPDSDLNGNSAGFTSSPVDILSLDIVKYDTLQIAGFLGSSDASSTPSILDWSVSYDSGPTPLPNISFNMKGEKIIGTDGAGNPIYKYDYDLQTDSGGLLTISDLEWDNYNLTVDEAGINLNISESCTPQPRSIAPGVSIVTDILLSSYTANSLLLSVTNISGDLIQDSDIRLYRLPYDNTQKSSSCGQTFFSSLSKGTVVNGNPYSIDISKIGYTSATISDVEVNGASKINIVLE